MIFNLFKAKPTLKELIPKGFVDIHSHILPGIDDGAKNIEESIKLISEMKKMGFSKIIATPHIYPGLYNNTGEKIKKCFKEIKDVDSSVSYAAEYLIGKYMVEHIEKKSILTLKDNYVLVEINFHAEPLDLYDVIFKLKTNGFKPILAHPERYLYYLNDFNKFYKLKKFGCLFQLNFLSITGFYGKKVLELSNKLLDKNLIDFTASDIHNHENIKNIESKILIKNKNISKLNSSFEKTCKVFL